MQLACRSLKAKFSELVVWEMAGEQGLTGIAGWV